MPATLLSQLHHVCVPLQCRWTPLHWAAYKGHAPIVALLLATSGVDPLAREGLVRGDCREAQVQAACIYTVPLLFYRDT